MLRLFDVCGIKKGAMSENINSFPGEQAGSEEAQPPSKKRLGGLDPEVGHELRGHLTGISIASGLFKDILPSDHQAQPLVDVIQRETRTIQTVIAEAIERQALPEIPLSQVYLLMEKVLKEKCLHDISLEGKCVFEQIPRHQSKSPLAPIVNEAGSEPMLRVVLHALSPDIEQLRIHFSESAGESFAGNFIKNSLRKGAHIIRFKFEKTGSREVTLSVSDDGEGMKLGILEYLRAGIGATDKTLNDGIGPGDSKENHGLGMMVVSKFVKLFDGDIRFFSVKKNGVKDPAGDAQDEKSLNEHPYEHGLTIKIRLPVKNPEPNDDHVKKNPVTVAKPQAPVHAERQNRQSGYLDVIHNTRQIRRRDFLKWTGAAAVTIGGVGVALHLPKNKDTSQEKTEVAQEAAPQEKAESARERIGKSPIIDIVINEDGRLQSFTLDVWGTRATFERGKKPPSAFRDVLTVPLDGGSLTIIDPMPIKKKRMRPMFVCALPEGFLCHVDIPSEQSFEMAYMCGAYDERTGRKIIPDLSPFSKKDTVFNVCFDEEKTGARSPKLDKENRFYAISMELLGSTNFRNMIPSLQQVADRFKKQTLYTPGALFSIVRPDLMRNITIANLLQKNTLTVTSREELHAALDNTDCCIIPELSLVQDWGEPLSAEETQRIKEHKISLCLPGVSEIQAQHLILPA